MWSGQENSYLTRCNDNRPYRELTFAELYFPFYFDETFTKKSRNLRAGLRKGPGIHLNRVSYLEVTEDGTAPTEVLVSSAPTNGRSLIFL